MPREAAAVRSRKLLEAAEQGNLALLKEMKNTLEKKNCGQAVPETLDGKVTHDSILDWWYNILILVRGK